MRGQAYEGCYAGMRLLLAKLRQKDLRPQMRLCLSRPRRPILCFWQRGHDGARAEIGQGYCAWSHRHGKTKINEVIVFRS